jgi:DNA-directed RNA polymerase II subunit RPB4
MTTRLRHKPQTEEEDASALKLGPGVIHIYALWRCEAYLCLIEFNNAGCLLISEVKYLLENRDKDAPDTAYVVQG